MVTLEEVAPMLMMDGGVIKVMVLHINADNNCADKGSGIYQGAGGLFYVGSNVKIVVKSFKLVEELILSNVNVC